MRKFLIRLIERLQRCLYNQKDDLRDWEWIKKELDKCLKVKERIWIVDIDKIEEETIKF